MESSERENQKQLAIRYEPISGRKRLLSEDEEDFTKTLRGGGRGCGRGGRRDRGRGRGKVQMKNGFMSADDESSTSDAKEDEELEKLRQVARRKYELENQFSSEEESLASQEVEEMQPSRELEVKEMQTTSQEVEQMETSQEVEQMQASPEVEEVDTSKWFFLCTKVNTNDMKNVNELLCSLNCMGRAETMDSQVTHVITRPCRRLNKSVVLSRAPAA